jgi:hypothetical protein
MTSTTLAAPGATEFRPPLVRLRHLLIAQLLRFQNLLQPEDRREVIVHEEVGQGCVINTRVIHITAILLGVSSDRAAVKTALELLVQPGRSIVKIAGGLRLGVIRCRGLV